MRILAIYRHYWPDTAPYARILRTIVEHFASKGHDVTVYAARPNYNDRCNRREPKRGYVSGVDVRRISLLPERKEWRAVRALNYLYFVARAIAHALMRRYDLVIANSHPPILMGCALRVIHALRGTPYIYHCQDLHPEAAALVGDIQNATLRKLLCELDAATCRHASRVVILSNDMADSLTVRGLSFDNVSVVSNAVSPIDPQRAEWEVAWTSASQVTRFLFAGNLGRFQGLERIIEAAHRIAHAVEFQLIFMGEGAVKRSLVREAGALAGQQILFLPHQPAETADAAIRACDYGIVSLLPNVYRYAFPSKTAAYLSAGCPLLAVVETRSELSHMIHRHDLGFVAPGHAIQDIARTLSLAIRHRDHWTTERRYKIAKFASETFGEDRILAEWDLLLGDCSTRQAARAAA